MKIIPFGLTVLGLALLSTIPAQAQVVVNNPAGSPPGSRIEVDKFGNIKKIEPKPGQLTPPVTSNITIGVGPGYFDPYPGFGYGYPLPYGYPPYPGYGYGYPGYPYPVYGGYPAYPYGGYPQVPVAGTIGIPGYTGPNFTSIPLGSTYTYPNCPPGYATFNGYGGFNGGFSSSYSKQSSGIGVTIGNGRPGLSINAGKSSGSSSTSIITTPPSLYRRR